jgi:hypothetical protein
VQANPLSTFQDTFGMTYSQRPTVAADRSCLTTFGGDPAQCPPILARVEAAFPVDATASTMRDACRTLPLDSIVVKDVDPVWSNPHSWVWTEQPAYSNAFIRVFQCARAPL